MSHELLPAGLHLEEKCFKAKLSWPVKVRGDTKFVLLKVERKLYSAYLLVRFTIDTLASTL
jgi:hypothetical protein